MARYLTLFTFCVATAFLNAPKECLLAVTRMRSEDWLSALRAVVGSAHPPCTCRFAGPVDAALSDVGRGAQNLRRIPPFEHSGHGQVSAGERRSGDPRLRHLSAGHGARRADIRSRGHCLTRHHAGALRSRGCQNGCSSRMRSRQTSARTAASFRPNVDSIQSGPRFCFRQLC